MRLATRISLGYWYLVMLLVITAAGAALGFHTLGNSIGRVLAENFESVRASTEMVESLERQDSALLALLLGKAGAADSIEASGAAFRDALKRARANITMAEERPLIEDIERSFAAFESARDQLLVTSPEHPLQAYDEQTFPAFEAVKIKVLHLLEINHQAIVDADLRAQRTATGRATVLALLVLVALFSLVFLSRALNRTVLERLDELATVAEAIAAGGLHRRAPAHYPDELGAVARQLNAVLDRQQQVQNVIEGRTALYRDLLIGLLTSLPDPAALVGLDGRIIASTLDTAGDEMIELASARISGLETGADEATVELESRTLRLHMLRARAGRPLAWLAALSDA